MLLALFLSTAPPALPPPFAQLEGLCVTRSCAIRIYAPKGSGLKGGFEDGGDGTSRLGVIAVAAGQKRCLIYSRGPSADPALLVLPSDQCQHDFDGSVEPQVQLSGEQYVVPGNGSLYGSGTSNAKFNLRQKWTLAPSGEWKRAAQPFFYVGGLFKVAEKDPLTGDPVAPIPLYAERKPDGEVVATIAPGQRVEVLLADPEPAAQWFLVRTEFGLVGWHHSPKASVVPDGLGLAFHGD